jgi:Holliday junction resolvasome RuvABC endonuclease subunit
MMRPVLVLGIDPGLRATGCALVEVDGDRIEPLALFVLTTKPWKKGQGKKPTKSADNARCASEIAEGLERALRFLNPGDAMHVEAFSIPNVRLAGGAMRLQAMTGSACKTALVWGVLATFSRLRGVPIEQASPQRVKRAIAGRVSASKDEVRDALARRFGRRRLEVMLSGVNRGLREHAHDALAVAVALALPAPVKVRRRAAPVVP